MVKLGLRIRFFLYSNTLIAVTMILVTVLLVVHERRERYQAIESRGRSIAEALAIPVTDALMHELGVAGQSELIEGYISQVQMLNRDLMRYATVSDPLGTVIHAVGGEQPGRRFGQASDVAATDFTPQVEIIEGRPDERILEVRTPLQGGGQSWGMLKVGYSLEPIEQQMRSIAKQAALVALLLMIGNSAMTAVYVETLIRPILGLHQGITRATRGDLTVRAGTQASAEVHELAEAFNRLMDELEEARAREKQRQAQLAHTEKMAAVGTLAAGVAHEVNNPLGGIMTCIENMRADLDDHDTVDRYLTLIHDGLKRIERTVANLLDFSRQREMVLEPTSINHSLLQVAELVKYQLRQGHVHMRLDLDAQDPFVLADHFQMEQLFLNLVLNALQAMPEGGRITLRTRGADGQVIAEVADTGVGISEEIRERIFDPFFTTRQVDEGTGLGLTVSDSIVASHGGRLELESTLGEGSQFRIFLPMLSPDAIGESV